MSDPIPPEDDTRAPLLEATLVLNLETDGYEVVVTSVSSMQDADQVKACRWVIEGLESRIRELEGAHERTQH